MESPQKPTSTIRLWLIAVRPFAYTASVLPVLLGAVLAFHNGASPRWGRLLLTLAGVVCFHTAANLLNDVYDFRRGVDDRVNPGSGAVVRGWITGRQAWRAALACLAAGVLCGLALTWLAGWVVLALGIAGTLLALGYTRDGFCLKYIGLGDAAIFITFGPLPVFGAYWVQSPSFSWQPLFWSLPMAAFTVAILHANNWRDITSDPARCCITIATRLGDHASRRYYQWLMLGPFPLVLTAIVATRLTDLPVQAPLTLLLVAGALPQALQLARRDWRKFPEDFAMLDARTARLHLLFGGLLTAGFILAMLV